VILPLVRQGEKHHFRDTGNSDNNDPDAIMDFPRPGLRVAAAPLRILSALAHFSGPARR